MAGLAAELLHALEFASLPLDGWLDGEDDETDWNNAQAVLHDLPCSTGIIYHHFLLFFIMFSSFSIVFQVDWWRCGC